MNKHLKEIKENQKASLKNITVDPPRFGYQTSRCKRYNMLDNVMTRGVRGSVPRGIQVTNFGSYIEDPRGNSSHPKTRDYDQRRAERKRAQYQGPYLSTAGYNDNRTITSEPVNKLKRERERIFRRSELDDIINISSSKQPQINGANTMDGYSKMESEASLTLERVQEYRVRTDFGHNEIRTDSNPIFQNNKSYKSPIIANNNSDNRSVLSAPREKIVINDYVKQYNINNVLISNRHLFGGVEDTIKKMNYSDLKAGNRNTQTTTVINNLILLDKSIKEYYQSKVSVIKSPYLTNSQKSLIEEYIKSGISEREIVGMLSKFNVNILNGLKSINHNNYSVMPSIETFVDSINRTCLPGFSQLRNFYLNEVDDSKISYIRSVSAPNFKIVREFIGNDEIIYDDVGRVRNKPTFDKTKSTINQNMVSDRELLSKKMIPGNIANTYNTTNSVDDISRRDRRNFVGTFENTTRVNRM